MGENYHCLIGSWLSTVIVLKEVFFGGMGVWIVPLWEVCLQNLVLLK